MERKTCRNNRSKKICEMIKLLFCLHITWFNTFTNFSRQNHILPPPWSKIESSSQDRPVDLPKVPQTLQIKAAALSPGPGASRDHADRHPAISPRWSVQKKNEWSDQSNQRHCTPTLQFHKVKPNRLLDIFLLSPSLMVMKRCVGAALFLMTPYFHGVDYLWKQRQSKPIRRWI